MIPYFTSIFTTGIRNAAADSQLMTLKIATVMDQYRYHSCGKFQSHATSSGGDIPFFLGTLFFRFSISISISFFFGAALMAKSPGALDFAHFAHSIYT